LSLRKGPHPVNNRNRASNERGITVGDGLRLGAKIDFYGFIHFDELPKSHLSDGLVKRLRSKLANFEEYRYRGARRVRSWRTPQ